MEAKPKARTLRRILVGTDFSRTASSAVKRGAMLAAEHGARLELVHVAPRVDRAALKRLDLGRVIGASPDPAVRERLDEALMAVRSHDVVASARLVTGAAPSGLIQEAERFAADLVVVGARGERSLKAAVIGTTAERLMERCNRDILVVKAAPRSRYRDILICVALGPVSCAVVRSALSLSDHAALHLLHVYQPPFETKLLSRGVGSDALARHRLATKQEAARAVAELLAECPVRVGRELRTLLRRGTPPHEILIAARELHAHVVVVGKNQSAVEEFFLGSATKNVIRSASSDVLIAASH